MIGIFFCDVCSLEFHSHSVDDNAVCPSCREDVLPHDEYDYEPDFLDPIDVPYVEDDADYN